MTDTENDVFKRTNLVRSPARRIAAERWASAKKTIRILKQILIILTFILLTNLSFGQKFMIKNNDTLPYKLEMEIQNGDTIYLSTCWTFEKTNGKIINQTDNHCLRQGSWILTDSIGNYWKGNYKNNNQIGVWQQFNKNGNLIKETRKVHLGEDSYLVKKILYKNNVATVLTDKKFLAFYIDNFFIITSIFFVSFFGRIFINSRIYNVENGTNYPTFYFGLPFTKRYNQHLSHTLKSLFTLWFFSYNPENKQRVLISNTLSFIALCIFFGLIIGFKITGEI